MAAPTADSAKPPAKPPYDFEKGRSKHRDPHKARALLKILWARLEGDLDRLGALERDDPTGWRDLTRYLTDGPMSIQWYEETREELEGKQRRYNRRVMGIAVLLFVLAFLLPFQPLLVLTFGRDLPLADVAGQTGLIDVAALMGVVSTGATVALRMSSQVVRYRRQAAVFHKASADLKEQLYRLEGDWTGRSLLAPDEGKTRLHPEFAKAVLEAVIKAQAILSQERDDYFETLTVDVSALTDNIKGGVQDMQPLSVLRTEERKARAEERRQRESKIAEATLAVRTSVAKLDELKRQLKVAPDDAKSELERSIRDEALVLRAAEQTLAHLRQ